MSRILSAVIFFLCLVPGIAMAAAPRATATPSPKPPALFSMSATAIYAFGANLPDAMAALTAKAQELCSQEGLKRYKVAYLADEFSSRVVGATCLSSASGCPVDYPSRYRAYFVGYGVPYCSHKAILKCRYPG